MAGILGLSLLSCGRDVTGPENGIPFGRNRIAALALAPQFPTVPGAHAISDLVPFERVRITLRRTDGTVAKDTTIDFPSTADSIALAVDVPLPITAPDSGLTLGLSLAYINAAGDTVFRGGPLPVTARPGGTPGASQPVAIPVTWVPPGGVVPTTIELTPAAGLAVAGTTTQFTAVVRDAQNTVLGGMPVFFTPEDTARASVSGPGTGLVTWRAVRGTARIIATLPVGSGAGIADTSAFDISLPASRLLLVSGDAQSATIGTALAQPLVLRVTASDSVPVAGVPVTFAVTTGGGALAAAADTSDVNGLVSTTWTLGPLVGAQSVTATAPGAAGATRVLAATGLAPVPTQVAVTAAPTAAVAGVPFAPVTVEVRDAGGALTPLFAGPVSIALAPNGAGATLLGTATVNAVAGVATFSDLRIERAATGLTLIATSGALAADTTAAFDVTAAAAAQLALVSGDAQAATVATVLPAPFVVRVTDAFANPVSGVTVDWAIVTAGGGALSATTTVTDAAGEAGTTLTLPAASGAVTVTATATGLTGSPIAFAASALPGTASQLVFTATTSALVAGVPATAPVWALQARDALGNLVTSFTGAVTVSLSGGDAGATLGGTTTANAVGGIVSFTDLTVDRVGTGYLLTAASAGLADGVSPAFAVTNAAAAQITLVSGDLQTGVVSAPLAQPFVVRVQDAFGNAVAGVTVNWAVTAGGGALSVVSSVTDAAGSASTILTTPAIAGTVTVEATVAGLAGSPQLFTTTVTAGAAASLVITSGPIGPQVAGVPLPAVIVEARDASGNLATSFTGTVRALVETGPVADSAFATAVGGVATFTGAFFEQAGDYSIRVSSGALATALSNTFTVAPAAPAALAAVAGNAQTGPVLQQLPGQVTFRVTDAFANPIPGAAVTVAVTTGGGTIGTSTGTTNASGELSTTWTLGGTPGTQSLTATLDAAPAIQGVATATATVGAAAQLAVTTPPTGTFIAGATVPDILVEARDGAGNVVTAFTGDVVGRIDSGPAAGPDSIIATAVAGVATFTNVSFSTAGPYTLRFTSAGLTDAVTPTFTIVPGAAAFVFPDSVASGDGQTGTVGAALAQPLRAGVIDSSSNPIAGVAVVFTGIRGPDTLSVDTVATDAAGIAAFTPTLPPTPGPVAYVVTSDGLVGSGFPLTVTVEAGAATQLVITQQPGNSTSAANIPPTIVQAQDALGNLATAFTGDVTVVVDSGPALGFTLGGTLVVTAVTGVTDFTGLTLDRAGQYRLRFTSPGLAAAVSAPFTIDAGAPAALTAVEGDAQAADASQALPDSLGVRLTDAFGNPIAGQLVSWAVSTGGGALAFANSLTDANGIARNAWTLGPVAGGQQATADAFGLGPVTFTANAAATVANIIWTGAVNGNWSEPGNWTGGAVPTAGDSVRIAAAGNAPVLDAPAFLTRLQVDAGVTLQLDTFPLFVSGTLDVLSGATVLSDSIGSFVLTGAGNVRGAMPRLHVQNGTYALDGGLTVAGDLMVTNGQLEIGAASASVGGTFATIGAGRLAMTGLGALTVSGDAIFSGGSTAGLLTSGTLTVLGDFNQGGGAPDAFSAGIGHTTVLGGTARQVVTIVNSDAEPTPGCTVGTSCFGRLQALRGAGAGALEFATGAKALLDLTVTGDSLLAAAELISGGVPSLTADVVIAPRVAWQNGLVRTAGLFQVDTLVAWGAGALIVGETVPTIVLGNFGIAGAHPAGITVAGSGALAVNGVALVGQGPGRALTTLGNGRVLMQEAGDTLVVSGTAAFGGITAGGLMTAGLLEVTGDSLLQTDETESTLLAEGAHVTRLSGANPVVRFLRITGNQLANLEINSASAMTFDGNATIAGDVVLGPTTSVVGGGIIEIGGDLVDAVGSRWQVAETFFNAADPVIPPQFTGSVVFNAGVVLDTTLVTGGSLEVRGGELTLNGRRVEVGAAFQTRDAGWVRMATAADTLVVLGDATFRGASTAGQLIDGVLELHGNLTQLTTADAFAASGAHQTWFMGLAVQAMSFANPGTGAGSSHFAALGNGQTAAGASVQLSTDAFADGMLLVPSAPAGDFVGFGPQLLTTQGADVRGVTFTSARWMLVDGAPVNVIDTIGFLAQDPALEQFAIVRNGGTIGLGNPSFATVPSTGRYLRVEDVDGPTANGTLTVNVANPSPAEHGGFLAILNGAVVNGWLDFTGLEWTGAVSTDWTDPGNWAQGRAPVAADSVRIPATGVGNLPTLSVNAVVRALVNEHASPISIDAGAVLGVSQRLALRPDVPGVVCTSAFVDVGQGVTAATMGGRADCAVRAVANGTVTLDGPTHIGAGHGLSTQGVSQLVVNGHALTVEGNFDSFVSSRLVMTNAADSVDVGGASFDGASTAGSLTAGTLVVRGALAAGSTAGSFTASGTHVTRFASGVGDTVAVSANLGPIGFGSLEVERPVRLFGESQVAADALVRFGAAVVGPGRLAIAGSLTGTTGTLVAPSVVELGGVFADTGFFRPDTTIFAGTGQVMPFQVGGGDPEYRAVRITGAVTIAPSGGLDSLAGPLLVSGAAVIDDAGITADLRIAGDLAVTGTGSLASANLPHVVNVYGNALFDGADSEGLLQLGTLVVTGNFASQASVSPRSFRPAAGYVVRLDGNGTVAFADPVESRFGGLDVQASGIVRQFLSDVNVLGTLRLGADGGATYASNILGPGGTRLLTANGLDQPGAHTFRNVALRLQGAGAVNTTTTLTFADFDPAAVQFEIARGNGTIFIYDPVFTTVPSGGGRYLRVVDANVGDADPLTVNVDGVPSPLFHGGNAEAVAPAILNGWAANPTFTWTGGATTSDWTTPANWSGGVVPTAADSVFVPGALLYNPVIPDGTVLRAFTSARTESPITAAGTFTVTERLHVPTLGGLDCGIGQLQMNNNATTMGLSGRIACFTRLLAGTVVATDTLLVVGNDLQVEGTALLDAGADLVQVTGQFSTQVSGRLAMQNDSAHVDLQQGATFSGASTDGLLIAGRLDIGGNFTQNTTPGAFAATGAHVTAFIGNVTQQVDFANPGEVGGTSHFANLEVGQTEAGVSVLLNTDAYAVGQLRSGAGVQRQVGSSAGLALYTHGAAVDGMTFDNARWEILDGAPIGLLTNVSFVNQSPTVPQLSFARATGVVAASALSFATVPTSGFYIRVDDPDGAAGGSFVLSLGAMSPTFHDNHIAEVNGATIIGWAALPDFVWTGATSGDWYLASNWSAGTIPTGTDSVHIPAAAPNMPVIVSGDTAVAALTMESGATLQHAGILYIRGSADLAPGAQVISTDQRVELTGAGPQSVRGTFNAVRIDGGQYSLVGATSMGNLDVYNGDLSVGNHDLTLSGGLFTGLGGTLTMTGTGTVDVATYANFFGDPTAGRLTSGILRVRGDFEQIDSGPGPEQQAFSASGAHVVELAGTGDQLVRFSSPDTTVGPGCATSCFATLRSVKPSGAVLFANGVKALGDLDLQSPDSVAGRTVDGSAVRLVAAGAARFSTPVLTAGAIAWGSAFVPTISTANLDSLVAWGADTTLVGLPNERTLVTGSYRARGTIGGSIHVAGALDVDGNARVLGDLLTLPGGTISMGDPGDALQVDSTATFGGASTAGLLTAGTLRVGGNVAASAPAAFAPSGTHRTVLFDGCALCDGYFITLADTLSHFQDLDLESGQWTVNPSSAELHVLDDLTLLNASQLDGTPFVSVRDSVFGDLGTTLAPMRMAFWGAWEHGGAYLVDTLYFDGASQLLRAMNVNGAQIPYNAIRVRGPNLVVPGSATDEVQVSGEVVIEGDLSLGFISTVDSIRVQVGGGLRTEGLGFLRMTNALGRLSVGGNALFAGGSTTGTLTAGTLIINGNFAQSGDPTSFQADPGHITRFSTEGGQSVSFANPGDFGAVSRFGTLVLQQAADSRLELLTDVFALGQFREQMGSTAVVRGDAADRRLIVQGANLGDVRFHRVQLDIRDGAPLEGLDALVFDSLSTTIDQLVLSRPGGAALLGSPTFLVVPDAGFNYLVASDVVADADVFTVNVTAPTPGGHNGQVATGGGAVITGWGAADPAPDNQWTGSGGNTDWDNAANWSLGRVPLPTDSVTIAIGAGTTVNLAGPSTVAWLIAAQPTSAALSINSGGSLQVDSAAVVRSLRVNSGSTLTGDGSVTVTDSLEWNGGTMSGTGGTLLGAGGVGTISNSLGGTLDARTLIIGGTARLGGGGFVGTNAPNISVLSGGVLEFPVTADYFVGASPVTLVNQGTVRKLASAGTVRIDWAIVNTGTIEVQDETLDLRSTLDHAGGTIAIAGAATLVQGGELTAAPASAITVGDGGSLTLQGGGVSANPGNHDLQALSSLTGAGTLRTVGADTVLVAGFVDIDSLVSGSGRIELNADTVRIGGGAFTGGGFFSGTAVVAIGGGSFTGGTFSIATGNVNGAGRFYVAPTATLSIPGAGVRGWDIDVAGTWTWGDNDISLLQDPGSLSYPSVTIRPGGLWRIAHAGTTRTIAGSALTPIDNQGSIVKVSGTVASILQPPVTSASGTMRVESGTVELRGVTLQTASILEGTGTVEVGLATPRVLDGRIEPGSATTIGTLTVNGPYAPGANGFLNVELGAFPASDMLVVNGTATLGGTIRIFEGAVIAGLCQSFTLLQATSIVGSFGTVIDEIGVGGGLVIGATSVVYNTICF